MDYFFVCIYLQVKWYLFLSCKGGRYLRRDLIEEGMIGAQTVFRDSCFQCNKAYLIFT